MPKPKGKKRTFEKRLFIVCEGSKEKSEDAYLTGFLRTCKLPPTVHIKVVDVKKNTGKELVEFAADLKESEQDQVWVVYDKDGYSKHSRAFEMARAEDVKIAFSSISFEVWILLHFEYTAKPFRKSADVIRHMKQKKLFVYSKKDKGMYQKILKAGGSLDTAMDNAEKIQTHQSGSNQSTNRYDFNAYTDVDKLITAIRKMIKKK